MTQRHVMDAGCADEMEAAFETSAATARPAPCEAKPTLPRRCGTAMACAFAVAALSFGGIVDTAFTQSIEWRSAPREDLTWQTAANAAADVRAMVAPGETRRVILQFDAPITPADRARLDAAGVALLSPLGANAYFATVDGTQLNTRELGAVNALRAAAPIQREHKLHQLILDEATPDWAVVGERAVEGEIEPEPVVAVNVLFHPDVDRGVAIQRAIAHQAFIRAQLQTVNGLVLELPHSQVPLLADEDVVQWIETPLPQFSTMNAENRAVTQADDVQASPYNLDGTGVGVLVYDGGAALASHSDFSGRLTVRDNDGISNHATHVSGTIGGDGSNTFNLRGMAPNVTIESYGFQWANANIFLYSNPGDIEQDYGEAINSFGVDIANNSIGTNTATNGFPCNITGEYGITDTIIDAIVRGELGAPLRVVWANGNERQSTNCGNTYFTTAPPACAKNHLTVGATNSNDMSMTGFSSWGPCNDGRIKPDLVAPGCESGSGVTSTASNGGYTTLCGTSMASPTVAGLVALLLEDHRAQFPDRPDPLPSTVKSLLIQTTLDLGNPGPDFQFGYGHVQIQDAIDFMRTGNFVEDEIGQDDIATYTVVVDEPQQLKVTLAWDDPSATPNVSTALINDLDLLVTGPGGTHLPWTLNPGNPSADAVRTQSDHVNNIEQVVIDVASPGEYTVQVIGGDVPLGPQRFSLAAGPSLINTLITLPDGAPSFVAPGEPTPVLVRIESFGEEVVDGSGTLHVQVGGDSFDTVPLTPLGDDLYEAMLPAAPCGEPVAFFFSAEGETSGVTTHPAGGASIAFTAQVGELVELFFDDFSTDQGWTAGAPDDNATSGHWERANPNGSEASGIAVQPGAPYAGAAAYITGQHPGGGAGANDVDNGKTTLFSPFFDLSDHERAVISYRRWYANAFGASPNNDIFVVDISNDGGDTWTNVETIGPAGSGTHGGWLHHAFAVEDYVAPTDAVQVRFIASDLDPQALIEAAVDVFRIETIVCDDPSIIGDLDNSGVVDGADLAILLGAWGPCADCDDCDADLDGNCEVDGADLAVLLGNWG